MRYQRCRVTMRWSDDGRVIRNSVHSIGWDNNSVFWGEAEEKFAGSPSSLLPVRGFLRAIGPPDCDVRQWANGYDSYLAWSSVRPAFEAGSSASQVNSRASFPFLLFAFSILPFAYVLRVGLDRRRSRSRHRTSGCRSCGYNLTGNTSGVCPECGTAVARKVEVTT